MNNQDMDGFTGFEVAIIGMAGRFPGARDIHEFWNNLKSGREAISFLTDEELEAAGVSPQLREDSKYVKASGSLDEIEYFDAFFFDYTPEEAEVTDPQTRIFHQCVWHALEDAGCDPESYHGLIGLYAGAADHSHWQLMALLARAEGNAPDGLSSSILANKDYLCTRISYNLNLKGPSTTLINACSTSLVAVHMAYHGLLSGQCDMALAGGISLGTAKKIGYRYQEGMMLSPDGHCRTFDARAAGTMFGGGVGVVALKRLTQALEDRHHIYAVIKGTGINNDGRRKVGFTAPSVEGQAEVIKAALQMAEVEPETVTYIETHGTATSLGDTIEFEALKKAFNTQKKQFCRLGAVKTNVGHLDTAAGVTGLIKTALALKHRLIPPSLHFEIPNPKIDLENSPFCINTELVPWENDSIPLRAGVSAFGIGGTNVHVVLEEFPGGTGGLAPLSAALSFPQYQLILLSARTPSALDKMTQNLVEYLKNSLLNHGNQKNPVNPGLTLADAAYTLQVGRKHFEHRKMLVSTSLEDTCQALSASGELPSPGAEKVYSSVVKEKNHEIVFMFPGLGSQYVNMGWELYEKEPYFRQETLRCFEILETLTDFDIKQILYPSPGDNRSNRSYRSNIPNINHFEVAQLVVFTFEYALAKLLMHWGIKPHALIGYSFGEYAAACISGVFSLEDALKLAVTRGQLIRQQPAGIMLSVPASKEQLEPLLTEGLSIAVDNGSSCVVSGPCALMEAFETGMKKKRYMCMRLEASHAIHSCMMEPVLERFTGTLASVSFNKPRIPYISNLTGTWITVEQARNPAYWAAHLRETVRFADGIKELIEEPNCLFIEIGPGRDLLALIQRYMAQNPNHHAVDLVKVRDMNISDLYYLLNKIGQLWLYGVKVN